METGNVAARLRELIADINAYSTKIYEELEKSGMDAQMAELFNSAQSRDDLFLVEQLTQMRNTMDQWFYVIRYLNNPVQSEGRLKPIHRGCWALNGVELKDGTQLEYIDGKGSWQFGLLKQDAANGGFCLLDIDMMPITLPLDDLRVRTRQDIGKVL